MDRDGGVFEILVVLVAGIALGLVGAVWAGASLALAFTGDASTIPFSVAAEALIALPGSLGDPAAAWPPPYGEAMPAVPIYWLCTLLVGLVAVAPAVA